MIELTFPRHFKEKRLIQPKIDNLNGKIEGEITRVTPKYFPSTDTARLQKISQIMELQPAFTLKLMLQDFPPDSFSHVDIHEELMVPSGIYRSQLIFGSYIAPRMKLTFETTYGSLVSNGIIHNDDIIVALIADILAERELEVQWEVIDALKSDVSQATCLTNYTTTQLKDLIMYLNKEDDSLRAEKQTYILCVLQKHLPDSFTALMEFLQEEEPEVHHNLSCRYEYGQLPRQPIAKEDIHKFLESKKDYQLVESIDDKREYFDMYYNGKYWITMIGTGESVKSVADKED